MNQPTSKKACVAVFDFDGTTIEGSSPSRLVNRLMRERKITFWTSFKIGLWGLAYKWQLPQNEAWVRGQVFSAFEGKPQEVVDSYLRDFYDTYIDKRVRPAAVSEMKKRKEEGCDVIVVSASFEPIVRQAMKKLPFDYQISTRMRVAPDGTYMRQVEGRPIEGHEKLIALKHWCDGHYGEGNWELDYAYGDHHSDEPLLEAAKHPFAVSPNSGLKKIAKERNWDVLEWDLSDSEETQDE